MATTQHIGPRIIPVFAPDVEWDITKTYEPLMMVQNQGETFMSRQYVPTGIQLPDYSQGAAFNDYWVHMSNWNAQVEAYREEVLRYVELTIDKAFSFETVSDMKDSDEIETGTICHTNGFHNANDNGGAWYKISNTGTANEHDVIECGDYYAILIPELEMNIRQFGAMSNSNDDSSVFDDACVFCKNNGCKLVFDNAAYNFENSTTTSVPSLIGNETTIALGNQFFTYDDGFELKNISFTHEWTSAKTSVSGNSNALFTPSGAIDSVTFENVSLECVNADDSNYWGCIFIRCGANEAYVNNVTTIGARCAVIFNNQATLVTRKLTVTNIVCKNAATGVDVEGFTDNQYNGYVNNVTIANVTLINNATQQQHYASEVGHDAVLVGGAKNLTIENVYAEYVIERAVYCNMIRGGSFSHIKSIHGEGIKVAGYQYGANNYFLSRDLTVSHVHVEDAPGRYCATFYEVERLSCTDMYCDWPNNNAYYGISLRGICRDVSIDGVRGSGSNRGIVFCYPDADKVNELSNIVISNVVYKNAADTGDYAAIRFAGNASGFATNVTVRDCYLEWSNNNHIGIISADYVNGLNIFDCNTNVISLNYSNGIDIGANCSNVNVKCDYRESNAYMLPLIKTNIGFVHGHYNANRNSINVETNVSKNSTDLNAKWHGEVAFSAVLESGSNQYLLPAGYDDFTIEATGNDWGYTAAHTSNGFTEIYKTGTPAISVAVDAGGFRISGVGNARGKVIF